ncbi:MAG: M81 family metallopeptidase, partial [Pseudomonadota bacterium]
MKILVGALGHESNTFTSRPTRLEDFLPAYGDARDAQEGITSTLEASGAEVVLTISRYALPGGRVERSAYEKFKNAILSKAHDVDGVCLFMHGAMLAEGVDCCENDLLAALRQKVGPQMPIVLALDLHANILPDMIENADAIAAYHTAPHIDGLETGVRAANLLLGILNGEIKPEMGFAKVPMLLPGEFAQTRLDPTASLVELMHQVMALPGVLDASLLHAMAWADVPNQGVSAIVVTDGDASLAQREANRLISAFWSQRQEFHFPETRSIDDAIEVALAAPESTVFLSDSGDNTTAGTPSDITVTLERLIAHKVPDAVYGALWDTEAVEACMAAGVGKEITLTIGGKVDKQYGPPLKATGTVRILSDGRFYRGGVRKPENLIERGSIAVWRVGGIDVVLSHRRTSITEPEELRSLGIEPLAYKIVVIKAGYLDTALEA